MLRRTGINTVFRAGNVLTGWLLVVMILGTISLIVLRGLPALATCLGSEEIQFAIRLSLYTAGISTLLCIIFALPTAYYLARSRSRLSFLLNTVLDIPLALTPLVAGVGLLLLFGTTSFGKTLAALGLEFVFTVKGIIMAQFFVNVSFMVKVCYSAFCGVSPRLEFVARSLGYNQLETFCKITLPLARNGLLAAVVITWAKALGEFGAALMLAGATRLKTEILPLSLYLNISTGELDLAMASASILIGLSLTSLLIFEFLGRKVPGTERAGEGMWL
ncbi:MAG: ABC transporter permease [Heliobacteriaceae bacterium]|nr:ABC transporter permease [Heliobacteriaceae bacterium]